MMNDVLMIRALIVMKRLLKMMVMTVIMIMEMMIMF